MVFMIIMMVIGAVFLSFSLQDFIMDDDNAYDMRLWTFNHYGSSMLSIYTLFEVTFAGCWPQYFRPLVERVTGWYVLFILLYVSVVIFGLTRIVTALFLKKTLQVANNDADQQAHDQGKQMKSCIDNLRRVFIAVDTSGDGQLTLDEFNRICLNPDVLVYLKMLELDVTNAEGLFSLIDTDNSGEICWEDFLRGVMRLRGHARSLDLVAMMRSSDRLYGEVQQLSSTVNDLFEELLHHAPEIRQPMHPVRSSTANFRIRE